MAKKPEAASTRKSSKPLQQSQNTNTSKRWIWIVAGAAAALLALLALVGFLNSRNNTVEVQAGTVADRVGQPVNRRSVGAAEAPVLIEAYEDYQCPHCQDFAAALEPTILDDLVAPGIARFEYKNRFVIDQNSVIVASAAECAADQERFWEYHDRVFASLSQNAGATRSADLKKIAADIGLDTGVFNGCLDTQKHYETMLREDADASDRGVNSTPYVFINGVQYTGAYEPAAFKQAVMDAAAQSGAAQSPEESQ